jgi:FAD synthetase
VISLPKKAGICFSLPSSVIVGAIGSRVSMPIFINKYTLYGVEMNEWLSDPAERLRVYLNSFKLVLEEAEKRFSGGARERGVVELARRYYEDARYSYEKEDYITGLIDISYAEGLLDSLRILGITEFTWRKAREPVVFVGGTFDIVHPGHVAFLREAAALGRLYVVVARDSNVRRFKGYEPVNSEEARLEVVSSIRYVYRAFLGDEIDYLKSVERIRPDIVVLGPDQFIDEDTLRRSLEGRGLAGIRIVRLERRVGGYSTSNIIRRILDTRCRC